MEYAKLYQLPNLIRIAFLPQEVRENGTWHLAAKPTAVQQQRAAQDCGTTLFTSFPAQILPTQQELGVG